MAATLAKIAEIEAEVRGKEYYRHMNRICMHACDRRERERDVRTSSRERETTGDHTLTRTIRALSDGPNAT